MKTILSIFGTRPEAIKMAPVIKELEKHPKSFKSIVCVTAQHREMLDQVLNIFGIHPEYDLNIMKPEQDLYDVTANVLLKLRNVLVRVKPDIVLVHGDTTTTMAASLASFYAGITIGHVEAGLRTHNKYAPFPEEINRKLADAIADIHFAPTEQSKQNLLAEGIPAKKIYVTGNTVIDALFLTLKKIKKEKLESKIEKDLVSCYPHLANILRKKSESSSRLILVTGHRRENFGEGFEKICLALKNLSEREDVHIIYPVHLNPNVQKPVKRILGKNSRIHLIEPLNYLPFVYLMNQSYLILTDSGGIQEEAPSLGKPVLVMRETTERPEAVDAGTVKLVGTDPKLICSEAVKLLTDITAYRKMSRAHNPYGDGKAAERIIKLLSHLLVYSASGGVTK
ncbi:udp-n-acetylglucosamine 2-epimerase [hydrocarbon metagenome]|uniref:UDP-N-acetylglucosamine 2-epimerase (non-hydrolyzing) n=1 Tax=hydrocarbon metagenome TaxID=938273 RepID=A0A0W8FPT4_9ZZZZ